MIESNKGNYKDAYKPSLYSQRNVEKAMKDPRTTEQPIGKEPYHNAKIWEIGLFSLNNTSTNMYLFMIGFVSYYATGLVGLGVVLVSALIMSMRIWDAVTDPIIGFILDKTDGRFGKNRPFILIGNLIMMVTSFVLFACTYRLPMAGRLPFFILIYALYIIGYTVQSTVTKSALSCLTNDPKQRPLFTTFDSIYSAIMYMIMGLVVTNMLIPKYGQGEAGYDNPYLYMELWLITAIASFILAVLAIVGLYRKDRTQFFGFGTKQPRLHLRDYANVLRHNRPIQMLVIAASSDKLFNTINNNAIVQMMFFGIICGDIALAGQIGAVVAVPSIVIAFLGIRYIAARMGQKKALVVTTIASLVLAPFQVLLIIFGNPASLSLSSPAFFTIAFLLLTILNKGATYISGGIVIPMTADCADYETYRSGKYVPGLIACVFSFVDKFISSFASLIVGVLIASIGFVNTQPNETTPLTTGILWVTLLCMYGLPVIGWLCNLIAMKFYPLDKAYMEKIQTSIAAIKDGATKIE